MIGFKAQSDSVNVLTRVKINKKDIEILQPGEQSRAEKKKAKKKADKKAKQKAAKKKKLKKRAKKN